jgi:1,4-alpha-glucan branching enzyme
MATIKKQIKDVIEGRSHDPFAILGAHPDGKGFWTIRVFQPTAAKAECIVEGLKKPKVMKKVDSAGLFEVRFKKATKPAYDIAFEAIDGNRWVEKDAYAFLPVLSDFDLHLFNEGNHYRIYEKLGANVITHEGAEGVHFAVWAPNAVRVSVVGDFNYWDGRRHQMRALGASGVWEIFVPGISYGQKYKYELLTKDSEILLKSDPFGHYMEMRPKTASIVYEIGKYEWQDSDWMAARRSNSVHNKPMSIYEVHLASWKRVPEEGNRFLTYRELADQLIPYVREMGYTHIELMPLSEYPFDGSWGYQIVGYYAPTSRFGTPDDFAWFIDQCHLAGIGVIMDWVPAHFPMDGHGLRRFDGTALFEHEDPRKGYHMDWRTLIFNYGRHEVRNFLIGNALFWLEQFHIDGLRVDAVSSMLYLDYSRNPGEWVPNEYGGRENLDALHFVHKLNQVLYQYFPGIVMIAEESTSWPGVSRPVDSGGLGFGMKWNMGWMNDYLRYISRDPIYRKHHQNDLTFSRIYAYTENFVLVFSHDEVVHGKNSMLNKMPGDDWQKFANMRLSLAYMYAHPGKKLHFMGIEFGQWDEWQESKSLDWHLLDYPNHQQLQKLVATLNKVYREEPALWALDFMEAGFDWINCENADLSYLAFIRKSENPQESIVIVANFTPIIRNDLKIGVPQKGFWKEIFNSDAAEFGGSNQGNLGGLEAVAEPFDGQPNSMKITLPPLGVVYFKQ